MPRIARQEIIREPHPWEKAIKKLRIDRSLTQSNVAAILGISQRAYADYELGNRRISVEHLLMLSDYYDVSMDFICRGREFRKSFSGKSAKSS